jgi:hypothetical protein
MKARLSSKHAATTPALPKQNQKNYVISTEKTHEIHAKSD